MVFRFHGTIPDSRAHRFAPRRRPVPPLRFNPAMSESGDSHSSGRPLLFTGFLLTGFVTTVLGPVLPWLVARWHLSDAAAGALFTIQFTGSIVAGALSGLIVARLGATATLGTRDRVRLLPLLTPTSKYVRGWSLRWILARS